MLCDCRRYIFVKVFCRHSIIKTEILSFSVSSFPINKLVGKLINSTSVFHPVMCWYSYFFKEITYMGRYTFTYSYFRYSRAFYYCNVTCSSILGQISSSHPSSSTTSYNYYFHSHVLTCNTNLGVIPTLIAPCGSRLSSYW